MAAGAGVICLALAWTPDSSVALIAAITIYLAGFGLAYPPAIAGGLSAVAERAGAASSLLGFAPQFSAAILGAAVVGLTSASAWPAAIAVAATTLVVVLFWLAVPRAPRKAGV
jgi:DHA1 family bicyclomycin/chloramphenicol resistance-like MFS transporter